MYELLLLNVVRDIESYPLPFREYLGGHAIASYVSQYDFRAKVYSCDVQECRKLIDNEAKKHKIKLLGFYVGADTRVMTGHIIRWAKDKYRGLKILAGGPEAYSLGEKFLRGTGCDYVVYGEGEIPVLNILRCEVDGIGDRRTFGSVRYIDDSGEYVNNPPEKLMRNLDSLPFPNKANSLDKSFRSGISIALMTGRGCPFRCAFCFEGAASKTVRLRSIDSVISEIEEVMSYNNSLKYLNIYDDTFTLDMKRLEEFCRKVKPFGLKWTCEGHVSMIAKNPEMLYMMADAGLIGMQLGIESGSREVLEAYNKHTTPEMIIDVVKECKKAGLHRVEGNYIIGGAFERWETIEESLEHANKLIESGRGIVELSTVFFAPYYGTPITKHPKRYGLKILPEITDHIITTMQEAVTETEYLSANNLEAVKKVFDKALEDKYISEAANTTKDELLKGWGYYSDGRILNQHWLLAWRYHPHISQFMRHLTPEEQKCTPDKFPIRTTQKPDSDIMRFSDGRRTIRELSGILGLSLDDTITELQELNNKCMVYFSEF